MRLKKIEIVGLHGYINKSIPFHHDINLLGFNSVPDLHSFGYRLAEKCEFQSLAEVRRKINAYLKGK